MALHHRTLRGNTLANLGGRLLPGLLTVAVVPLLLDLLGTEAYGLIGLFITFQVVFATLELGLTTTATREVARSIAFEGESAGNSRLVRTLEVVYWIAALAIGLLLAQAAGWIASDWLNASTLSEADVEHALMAGGVAIAARWPVALYRGVLDGLQLQVAQNAITLGAAIVRIVGAVAFVAWAWQSIVGFMVWQAAATLLEILVMGAAAWWSVGGGFWGAAFDFDILGRVWRLALSLTAVSVLGAAVSQVDRVVIADTLPLAELGYYTLALTATGVMPNVAASLAGAAMPRFTAQLATGDDSALRATYVTTMHAVTFITVGVSFALAFFANEILSLWVGSGRVESATGTVLTLLAIAYLLNALYAMPYTVALAAGQSRLALIVNLVSAPVVVTVTYALVPSLGIEGAGGIWVAVMAAYLLVYFPWVHRRVMRRELTPVLVRELSPYLAVGVAVYGGGRLVSSFVPHGALSAACLALSVVAYALLARRLLPLPLRSLRPGSLWSRSGSASRGATAGTAGEGP